MERKKFRPGGQLASCGLVALWAWSVTLGLAVGCGDDASSGTGACVANQTGPCVCDNGASGFRTCSEDGAWSDCRCGPQPAGGGGAGGIDSGAGSGAAGSAGSSGAAATGGSAGGVGGNAAGTGAQAAGTGGSMDAGPGAGEGDDAGEPPPEPPFDGGPCTAESLQGALTITEVPATTAPQSSGRGWENSAGELYAAATPGGGAVLAWQGADGVRLTHVDGSASRVGEDFVLDGNRPWGLAVNGDTWGVMVDRGEDILAFVVISASGQIVNDQVLIGGVDHNVVNNQWFGTGIRAGRLTWTGSQWAAYYTVNQLYDDGIAHYGDQLRFFEADGAPASTAWEWGCSHSMEVRLVHNGSLIGPVCASDCYPEKGIFFNHYTPLYPDETGSNCSGGYGTHLGGIVPLTEGFWVAFTAIDGRTSADAAVVFVSNNTQRVGWQTHNDVDRLVWLTEDDISQEAPHIAQLGEHLLVGWSQGNDSVFTRARIDTGEPFGERESIPAGNLQSAGDFFVYANGDVGWPLVSGQAIALARMQSCP